MESVKLLRVDAHAKIPTKGTPGSAYYDLYAAEECVLKLGDILAVSIGWRIEVPAGYFLDIRSRSSLAMWCVWIVNSPGTVDEDFRGELKVILCNSGTSEHVVRVGDRIAQCALMPVVPTSFEEVGELTSTQRGEKGYGSTGR